MKRHTKLTSILLYLFVFTLLFTSCKTDTNGTEQEEKTYEQSTIISEEITNEQADNQEELIVPQPIKETRLGFVGVGDNIIYGTKEARIHAQGTDRPYNYKPYYSGVSDAIANADIAFINQETLMCGDGYSLSYYPRFNSPQELGYDLVELGFDVINIANNHMLDKGADGLSKTIEFWKGMDALMIGGYEDAEDYDNVRILEKDGIRIAFLSYTEMTNGLSKPASSPLAIPYTNDEDIIRQLGYASECADLIIVSVHWGNEGAFTPSNEQERLSQLFADCGADVILGHHPHVIQPVKWLEGKDGGKTLCVYSLGNFMAQQDYDYNMVGGMISFDIVSVNEEDTHVENVIFVPTIFHFNSAFTDNNVYRFEDYPYEYASLHGVRGYYGHAISYERLLGYVTSTIDKEFLPEFFHDKIQ